MTVEPIASSIITLAMRLLEYYGRHSLGDAVVDADGGQVLMHEALLTVPLDDAALREKKNIYNNIYNMRL